MRRGSGTRVISWVGEVPVESEGGFLTIQVGSVWLVWVGGLPICVAEVQGDDGCGSGAALG